MFRSHWHVSAIGVVGRGKAGKARGMQPSFLSRFPSWPFSVAFPFFQLRWMATGPVFFKQPQSAAWLMMGRTASCLGSLPFMIILWAAESPHGRLPFDEHRMGQLVLGW